MSLITLLPILAIALIGGRLAAQLAQRVGLPGVFGELALGLALGPLLIVWGGSSSLLGAFGDLGALMLMLLAGLETDLSQLRRVGLASTIVAMCGALLPFGAGTALAMAFGVALQPALIVGVALSATSVSITAATLRELGRLNTRAGGAILAAAVIDDVIGLALLALVTGSSGENGASGPLAILAQFGAASGPLTALARLGVMAALAVALWVVSVLASKPLARLSERHVEGFLALAVGLGLLLAWSAQALGGMAPITGAYLAGVLLARAAPHTPLARGVETLASGFFATMFFVSLGLNVQLVAVPWAALAAFMALAVVTKIAGCGLGALVARLPAREALTIGVGMIPRGEVALIVAGLALRERLLDSGWFSLLTLLALATTLITPPLLKLAFAAHPASRAADAITRGLEEAIEALEGPPALAEETVD